MGFRVSADGVKGQPDKVEAMSRLAEPTDKKELRSALGLFSFYSSFVPHYADVARPLTALLSEGATFEWGDAQRAA